MNRPFFAYYETFTPPSGTPPGGGEPLLRKGLIALGRVEPYEAGVVCRHEQTLMGPKKDRMELLRATRTHLESLFLLYSDPERKIESRMDEAAKGTPAVSVRDEYGVLHELWDVNDPETIRAIQQEMAAKKLIIADGHHRYETALAFGRECRESHSDQERDCGFALMTLVNMDGDGILILSGHRLVAGVADWSPAKFLEQAREFFDVKNYPFAPEADRSEASRNEAMNRLRAGMIREQANGGTPIGLLMNPGNTFYRLDLRPEVRDVQLEELLPELSPAQRGLDVTLLHRVLLERCLGMDEASVKKTAAPFLHPELGRRGGQSGEWGSQWAGTGCVLPESAEYGADRDGRLSGPGAAAEIDGFLSEAALRLGDVSFGSLIVRQNLCSPRSLLL